MTFSRKAILFATIALFTATVSHAVYNPQWERPVFESKMKKISGRGAFTSASRFILTTTRRDDADTITGMVLRYKTGNPATPSRTITLDVTDIEHDECGSTVMYASIQNPSSDPVNGPRFHLTLTDHRSRFCEDFRPMTWEASIREGFGWCGTMDSTVELAGNPYELVSIQ